MARILIVDDEAGIRTILEHALAGAGYEVVAAETGREGIQKHQATPVDLIIVDVFMPDQDGLETITLLRQYSPNLPIIAMSGKDPSGAFLTIARQLGAARVLDKPFDADTLLKMVQELLPSK